MFDGFSMAYLYISTLLKIRVNEDEVPIRIYTFKKKEKVDSRILRGLRSRLHFYHQDNQLCALLQLNLKHQHLPR